MYIYSTMTAKEQKFCEEYLVDFNASDAARRAGYSLKTAGAIGFENLKKPKIQKYIAEQRAAAAKKLEITKEMVLEGYKRLAFYDARKFYDASGDLHNVPDLDEDTAFALQGIEIDEIDGMGQDGRMVKIGQTKKIKMAGRRDALDSICRVLGYNAPTKSEVSGKDGDPLLQPMNDDQVDKIIKALRETKTTWSIII